MGTGSKIEQRKPEFNIKRKLLSSFVRRTPNEPVIKTILFFLAIFLLISYYYVKPKTSVTKSFLKIMNDGNINKISELATDCTIYNNKKLNEAVKKEYLSQLSYIIQLNKLDSSNNFFIKPKDDDSFNCDIKIDDTYYGDLTKDLSFIKDKETYKLDINAYIKKVCTGSITNKTALEKKLLIRQLLYCYQYYMDDYINKGNTFVFKFIEKDSSLYKYVPEFKMNNLYFSQNTAYIEFKDMKLNGNTAVIDVYQTTRQDKNKIISLRKQNYSYRAVNINDRWLLNDLSLKN